MLGLPPMASLGLPGTQIILASANLARPGFGDRDFIIAVEAALQRNHHCRALGQVERQRLVNEVGNTGIHEH